MSDFVFLACCFLIDFIFSSLFPADSSMVMFIVAPCVALCGMLCLMKERNWVHGIYLAFVVGLTSDFIAMNTSMRFALIFTASSLIMRIWEKHLSSSILEQVVLLLSTVFVKESLLYLSCITTNSFQMSLESWLFHRCIPTLLGNIPLILLVIGMNELKKDYDNKQERNKRDEESLFWKMFK